MSLRVSDIGVFAMGHGRETLVHRVQSVRDDVDYIQPWVALRVPTCRGRHPALRDSRRGRPAALPARQDAAAARR